MSADTVLLENSSEVDSKAVESVQKNSERKDGSYSEIKPNHVFSDLPAMLLSKLNEQRRNDIMCDVTIVTEDGRTFRAHKSILAASSRYLEAELFSLSQNDQENSRSEAVIHLGMITSDSFEVLLDLVYTSKLILTEENVSEVLLAADILDLEKVGIICRQFLRSRIKSKSVSRHGSHQDGSDFLPADSENRRDFTDSFKNPRIGSKDSTSSTSSGFSSCSSSASFQKESDTSCSYANEMTYELRNCNGSISCEHGVDEEPRSSSVPNSTAYSPERQCSSKTRPTSAPVSPTRAHDVSLKKRKTFLAADTEQVDETCSGKRYKTSMRSEIHSIERRVTQLGNHQKSFWNENITKHKPHFDQSGYKVKSEVHILPGRYPQTVRSEQFRNCDDASRNAPPHAGQDKDVSPVSEEIARQQKFHSKSPERHQLSPVNYATLPGTFFGSRSIDSRTGDPKRTVGTQPGFLDLTTQQCVLEDNLKANESKIPRPNVYDGVNMGSQSPQGLFQGTSQFLASLYMLRSQTLNPASFLSPSYGLSNRPTNEAQVGNPLRQPPLVSDLHASPFAKRQLQHSNSVVTSSALMCKICRVEFTSEWSLSMHYRLYHPLSYLYQPSNQGDRHRIFQAKHPEKNEDTHMQNPIPLMRSTSSPCKLESAPEMTQGEEMEPRTFDFKEISESQATHKCYHCKKEFSTIFHLRKHKATEHMKRPFKCQRCDSAFPNKAGLSVHLRSHTGERPYRCKICDKAFTQLGHVQRHQKVHTGEKPYQCPLCQARVRDKASMHYHILAHQGVKPFKCDQCDARFTKRSSLVKHKNVHTGSFLYQCPQCKASFREKASLSRHIRSQHKEPCYTASMDLVSPVGLEPSQMNKMSPDVQNNSPVNLSMDARVDTVEVI